MKFKIYRAMPGYYQWEAFAKNGKRLARSTFLGYTRERDAVRGITRFVRSMIVYGVVDYLIEDDLGRIL